MNFWLTGALLVMAVSYAIRLCWMTRKETRLYEEDR